jgi:FlaA1/EpsC-like NDP-sugar epimerase
MFNRLTPRGALTLLHDGLAAGACWVLAYALRFNFDVPASFQGQMWHTLAWVAPVQAVVFYSCGLYRGLWRYASMNDVKRIAFGVSVAGLAVPVLLQFLQLGFVVPRSVLILQPLLTLFAMGGSRFTYRAWKEHRLYGSSRGVGKPVLILGAGDSTASLIKDLERSQEWRVVGLLDDGRSKRGHLLHGVRVLGPLEDLSRFAHDYSARHAIIALPAATHADRRRALRICQDAGVNALTVPMLDDLVSGKLTVSQIRRVEVEDLLGRASVVLDIARLRGMFEGKVVMVTGAGGSIGSELCRQVAMYKPGLLVLFEANEYALYRIEQEFADRYPDVPIVAAIGDVKSEARVRQIVDAHRPAVLFHAAAYKHVPLMERENAWEAVRNNVYGTWVVARAAADGGVGRFVLISTDKAVNPTNVMGASKRLAEMVCQGLQAATAMRFGMVRFGNVLASTGSVIPKFQEQIARGGPLTVTHPEITRYFMSIPEAARLVLQAGAMSEGGEIFVLDMGEPIKIVDLARDMIRLSGFSEDEIKIVFTGLRPGEKLFEELLADDERTLPTPHPKLRVARARPADGRFVDELIAWLERGDPPAANEVRAALERWVPEYTSGDRPRLQVVSGSAGTGR